MSIANRKETQGPLNIYKEKELTIVEIAGLDFIDWKTLISSFKEICETLNEKNIKLTENLLNKQFKEKLLAKNPSLKLLEIIFLEADYLNYHLLHIKNVGLRNETYLDQAIGFAAICLALGIPLAANKSTGEVVWDVKMRKDNSVSYQTFSEGKQQADYHTDTAFYEKPVKNFGLYCRLPANCGGGLNRFCNAASLHKKLYKAPDKSWIAKTLYNTKATFRVPSSFTYTHDNEYIDDYIFSEEIPVRFRLDSIQKGHDLKYGGRNKVFFKPLMHF